MAKCYRIIQCDNESVSYITDTDLSYYLENNLLIKLCPPQPANPIITFPPVTAEDLALFSSANYFRFTNCCNELETYNVVGNFAAYVGSGSINIHLVPQFANSCFIIESIAPVDITLVDIVVKTFLMPGTKSFAQGCEECLAFYHCPTPGIILTECLCFRVEACLIDGNPCPCREGDVVPVIVSEYFPATQCEECTMICYKLTDCQDPTRIVITNTDLLSYVGYIVKFVEYPSICWRVETSDSCTGHVIVPIPLAPFDTCELCLTPVPEEPIIPEPPYVYPRPLPEPEPLNYRMIKPGYNTPGCPPEYTEKVNCRFAAGVYQEMAVARYGVVICCQDDTTKWDVKKALLDLNAIYDPSLCTAVLPEPCESCPVDPIPDPSPILSCTDPDSLTSSIFVCVLPTNLGSVITFPPG